MSLSEYSLRGKEFLTYVVYEKSTLYVVKFRAQKLAIWCFNKIAFEPSQGLIQMNWGSKEECHCPSTVWGAKNFWPRWPTKKVLNTLSNFGLKKYACAISWKVTLNVVKDLFKWFEGPCRSFIILVGSNREIIFDLGCLRKKYSLRCQLRAQKICLCNFMKSDFQCCEGLVQMNWGSM